IGVHDIHAVDSGIQLFDYTVDSCLRAKVCLDGNRIGPELRARLGELLRFSPDDDDPSPLTCESLSSGETQAATTPGHQADLAGKPSVPVDPHHLVSQVVPDKFQDLPGLAPSKAACNSARIASRCSGRGFQYGLAHAISVARSKSSFRMPI